MTDYYQLSDEDNKINSSIEVGHTSNTAEAEETKAGATQAKQKDNSISNGTDNDTANNNRVRVRWYKRRRNWIKLVLVLLLISLLVLAIVFNKVSRAIFHAFLHWMIDNTIAGAFAFIGVYWMATVCLIPGSLLTLGAGYVFRKVIGQWLGIFVATLIVFTGASLGASTAFILGRFVFRERAATIVKKYPYFATVEKVIASNGFKVTLLLRLSPIIPFSVFNYAMGLAPVAFKSYNCAHIGMLPGTLAYCFIGGTLGALTDATSVGFSNPIVLIFTVVGTVVALIGMLYIAYFAKKEFKKLAEQQQAQALMPATE